LERLVPTREVPRRKVWGKPRKPRKPGAYDGSKGGYTTIYATLLPYAIEVVI
jgi:hypothetical protein